MHRWKKKSARTTAGNSSGGKAPLALTIDGLAWGGKAVGRHEGKVIFVSKAVPGDHLLVVLERAKSRYAEGRIEAVLRPGEDGWTPGASFSATAAAASGSRFGMPVSSRKKKSWSGPF